MLERIIGLTGGISCGKSTVSKILENDYNAFIIDADKIAKELCEPSRPIYRSLWLAFEAEVDKYFYKDKTLNRKALAELIFNDKDAKEVIENMMHSHIIHEMKFRAIKELVESKNRLIVLDAPLFFEVGLEKFVSKTIVVHLDSKEQLRRLIERNNLTKEEALLRINSQISDHERLSKADYVLDNNRNIESLKNGIQEIISLLQQKQEFYYD